MKELSGQSILARRERNARGLAAFGLSPQVQSSSSMFREIRRGSRITIMTIGYERRSGEDLIASLRDAGVDYLADIRDKPFSRRPDFRASSLQARCEDAGIEYGPWPTLGSTESQRDELHATGDLAKFHRVFRTYAVKSLQEPIDQLADLATKRQVALFCYERAHDECHRSVIADLIADRLNAGITAIL